MPSGTGKTVSLLSLIVSYQQVSPSFCVVGPFSSLLLQFFPTRRKLIYCSRTVPEIEKALTELKRLMEYRISCAETEEDKEKERNYTGLGLTSRKNLCINPDVRRGCFMRPSLLSAVHRLQKRRRARWLMQSAETLQTRPFVRKAGRILALSNSAIGTKQVTFFPD